MFVSPTIASKHYNVSTETLRLWALEGKIKFTTTPKGHHRYELQSQPVIIPNRKRILYGRVSSSKQSNDLQHQIDYLISKYPGYTVIKDIGSGINFKRKGIVTILGFIFQGLVEEIVVAHRDRLTRIGFELFEFICQQFNTKLTVLSDKEDSDTDDEFTEDFMSIITYFTAKYHGLRKYKVHKKDKNLSQSETN